MRRSRRRESFSRTTSDQPRPDPISSSEGSHLTPTSEPASAGEQAVPVDGGKMREREENLQAASVAAARRKEEPGYSSYTNSEEDMRRTVFSTRVLSETGNIRESRKWTNSRTSSMRR